MQNNTCIETFRSITYETKKKQTAFLRKTVFRMYNISIQNEES